jgi:hypothetical protein
VSEFHSNRQDQRPEGKEEKVRKEEKDLRNSGRTQ